MKKKIASVICVFLMSLSVIGCGAAQNVESQEIIRGDAPEYNDDLIYVGMIQTGKESDWRDANTNDYFDTFTLERGYELIYVDGNSSSERQVKAMFDLVQQNVDYIIVQPIIEDGWEEAFKAAKEAEIPVIVADRKVNVDEELYTSWVGPDSREEGKKAIVWLDQYLKSVGRENEEIDIVLLEGTPGSTAAIGRTEGILAGLKDHPDWMIVDRGSANFTQGEGQTYMEELLNSGRVSDIDVIISENDNMIFGAMKALERNGMSYGPDGDIIMVSFDALYEAFERMIAGELHASIECNPLLAGTVEKVILELEAGNRVEKVYNIEEGVYTFENAAEFIGTRKY